MKEGSNEIGYIDLLPVFQEESRNSRIYLDYDGHWSAFGNYIAAKTIATHLSGEKRQAQR
jgi:hypothetical protein